MTFKTTNILSQYKISVNISKRDMYNFNMRLKELRKSYKLTQSRLAQMLHISQNTYSQYETEKHQIPIESLIQLAKIYNVSVDYILCLTNIDLPYPEN